MTKQRRKVIEEIDKLNTLRLKLEFENRLEQKESILFFNSINTIKEYILYPDEMEE